MRYAGGGRVGVRPMNRPTGRPSDTADGAADDTADSDGWNRLICRLRGQTPIDLSGRPSGRPSGRADRGAREKRLPRRRLPRERRYLGRRSRCTRSRPVETRRPRSRRTFDSADVSSPSASMVTFDGDSAIRCHRVFADRPPFVHGDARCRGCAQ